MTMIKISLFLNYWVFIAQSMWNSFNAILEFLFYLIEVNYFSSYPLFNVRQNCHTVSERNSLFCLSELKNL